MKKILILALLLSLKAFAEDPPPLPPNPFDNLPPNPDAGFNPFEEDFEEDSMGEDGEYSPPLNPSADGGASSSRPYVPPSGNVVRPSFPPSGSSLSAGSSSSAGNLAISKSPGSSKMEPANCKDTVENFDYPDAEILDVTKAISKLTGKNFIYNPQDIKGRISVVSQTPITVCDAWNAFLTSLNMRGFALVPSGKYLRIERIANAKEKQTPIYSEKKPPNNDEFITRVIPLRYIDATEFENAFRLWMPREARMQAYGQTNTIIITDTATHINRMVELINLLDVAGYQESLVVISLKFTVAKDLAKLIEQILNDNTRSQANFGAPVRPQPNFNNGIRTATRTKGRSGGSSISKIIADDRTNTLIVKANAAGIQEIRALVRRLDTRVAASEGSGRIHVIRLKFADAETMAKTLTGITSSSGQNNNRPKVFPAFDNSGGSVFQGDIKVSADKTTQSLVVTASPQDFSTLKKVVESIDVPRDQVFIEALILEMALNRDNSFGTSFVAPSSGIALNSASGALAGMLSGNPLASGFALGFKKGNQKADISFGSGDNAKTFKVNSLNGLVELIQGNTDANVVATPKIIALDNEEATFEIAESIQVQKSTAANGVVTSSFEPDTAKISLKVKPQINKGSDFVKLEIDQRLENFDSQNVPNDLKGLTQGKNTRATTTKVVVQNEDTIVLSGLIRDSVNEVTNKVPLLGDIPILGWLFKNTKSQVRKTNLLVFITPTIIKQYETMRKVLDKNLIERDEFFRENIGSKDPQAKKISRMRKSLPDLTVIEPLPRDTNLESSSFSTPSSPDRDDDYGNDYYGDPNYYYPPDGGIVPLPPIDAPVMGIEQPMDGGDGSGGSVVMPEQ
ncbi:MAG: type II secretion system secretin GspD [Oligoflexia bacterium]|nr:type II secretion system secretin GspD [Oligoflexia bacterium]